MNYELSPRLTRVEIDKWGTIQNEVFDVSSSFTCLFGDSGSGKTTIVDAIQYVLTDTRKFNSSANGNDRSVKSYVRGDSGSEGSNKYLRIDFITSYIILEFYLPAQKDNGYLTLGVCIESPNNTESCTSSWFILPDTRLSDLNTVVKEDGSIKTSRKNELRNKGKRFEFYTGRKAMEQVRRTLGIQGGDLFSHIFTKMISCKPEANGNAFLKESFLRPCEITSIQSVRERRKAISEIKHNFDELNKESEVLEKMLDARYEAERSYQDFQDAKLLLKHQNMVSLAEEINALEAQIHHTEEELNRTKSDIYECELNLEELENEIDSVHSSEEDNLRFLENKIIKIKSMLNSNAASCNKLIKLSELLSSSGSFLMDRFDPENRDKVLKRLGYADLTGDAIAEKLSGFLAFVSSYNQEKTDQIAEINISLTKANEELNEITEKLSVLSRGDKIYPEEVNEAYKLAAKYIAEKCVEHKFTTVSDAVLEFVDDRWGRAIEAVLGDNRYGILTNAENCSGLKDYLLSNGITNVPVVMVSELVDTEIVKGSASEQLIIKDIDCRNFLFPILNLIHLCNDAAEMVNYSSGGLTCDGVYAFGNGIQLLDLANINSCLGKSSIQVQKAFYESRKKQIAENISDFSKQREELKSEQEIIRKVDVNFESYDCSAISNSNAYEEELQSLQIKLTELKNTPELIQAETVRREYLEEKKRVQERLKDLSGEKGSLETRLTDSKSRRAQKKFELSNLEDDYKALTDENTRDRISSLYDGLVSEQNDGVVISESECRKKEDEWRNKQTAFHDLKGEYRVITGKSLSQVDDSFITTRYKAIKNEDYAELNQKLINAQKEFAEMFINKFVVEIGECISKAKAVASEVNGTLKNMKFGNDSYKFIIEDNQEQREFFELLDRVSILSDNVSVVMRDPDLQRDMEVFMARILEQDRDEYYSDYRNYVNCRMKITTHDGEQEIVSDYAVKQRSASVGEKHTPYYVILIASLISCYRCGSAREMPSMRLVLIDEAFISISGERIDQLLELMRTYGLQVIFAAVPDKLYGIVEQCDAHVAVVKQGRYTKVIDGQFDEDD